MDLASRDGLGIAHRRLDQRAGKRWLGRTCCKRCIAGAPRRNGLRNGNGRNGRFLSARGERLVQRGATTTPARRPDAVNTDTHVQPHSDLVALPKRTPFVHSNLLPVQLKSVLAEAVYRSPCAVRLELQMPARDVAVL